MTAIIATQLFSVPSVPVVNGLLTTVPAVGGVSVPQNTYRSLKLVIGLGDADKLGIGNTLLLNSFFSSDSGATWQFINGFNWNSYGPAGLTVTDPDGAVHVNPDPTLYVPLNNVTPGMLMRLQYQAQG